MGWRLKGDVSTSTATDKTTVGGAPASPTTTAGVPHFPMPSWRSQYCWPVLKCSGVGGGVMEASALQALMRNFESALELLVSEGVLDVHEGLDAGSV